VATDEVAMVDMEDTVVMEDTDEEAMVDTGKYYVDFVSPLYTHKRRR